jgi:hypothetical protein
LPSAQFTGCALADVRMPCAAFAVLKRVWLQIFERKPTTVKNFGIWVRYQSRTGEHCFLVS